MSKLSEKPSGSKPTSPTIPFVFVGAKRKGRDSDISALRDVAAFPVEAGAKAEAEPIRARIAAIFIMVKERREREGEYYY